MGVDEIVDRLPDPAVGVITGKRGSGKDVTAASMAVELQKRTGKTVYSNWSPVKFRLPENWKLRRGLSTPKDAIILQSDAHLELFARDWRTDEASAFIKFLSISRHRNTDVIATTQLTRLIDAQLVATSDFIIFKEPSAVADRLERPEMRDLTAEARPTFQGKTRLQKLKAAWVVTHDGSFEVAGIEKPPFWTEEMSKMFGNVNFAGDSRLRQLARTLL